MMSKNIPRLSIFGLQDCSRAASSPLSLEPGSEGAAPAAFCASSDANGSANALVASW